jgi:hypothetical protein
MLNSTPRDWVAGELVTATHLNAEIRDPLEGIQEPWTAYTPVWTAITTNPTIGNGSLVGAYHRIGKTAWFRIMLTGGSTTNWGSGRYQFTLPVTETAYPWVFTAFLYDSSAGQRWIADSIRIASGRLDMYIDPLIYPDQQRGIGPNVPFGWAAGDQLFVSGTYEAA